MNNQSNKTAIVTGGTRGIGLAIAKELARMGFNLVVNGVREKAQVENVLAEIREEGARAEYCRANIAIRSEREAMVDFTLREFGRIDLLVNNAGIAPKERKDLLEASEESFEELIRTNLQGPYFLSQRVASEMVKIREVDTSRFMSIITISSISSQVASVNRGEYCVAKAGLSMMTKLYAARLGEYNIPVYEIQPGIIETDMTAGVKGKYDSFFESGLCILKRWGQPSDIAKAVGCLADGALPYATGQVLTIDGGITIQRL